MTDRNFGEIELVWKQLILSEVIAGEKPQEYWESHAGAARCPIPPSPESNCGIGYFARHAGRSPGLGSRPYSRQLQKLAIDGALPFYPGSPWLTMSLLGAEIRRYLFCDTVAECLHDIVAVAHEMRVPEDKVQCVQDDGLSILRGAGIILPEHWTASTLTFLNPPHILGLPQEGGITPVDLFCELTNRGIKTLLGYGFADGTERTACQEAFAAGMKKYRLAQDRHHFRRLQITAKDGKGCGIWCSNLGGAAIAACHKAGEDFILFYDTAKLPDGSPATFTFDA